MKRWVVSLAAAVAVSAVAAHAHHSISSVYDSSRRATLDGVVAQFQLVNPHPFLFIDVKDAAGQAQRWRLEMDNRWELAGVGVAANTFKPGDRVVVSGSLARTQSQSLYLLRLDRPLDGFWYEQVGAGPKIGTRSGPAADDVVTWTFDRLDRIGGHQTTVVGEPRVIDAPVGKAIEFDGVDDAIFLDVHPLEG